MIAATVEPVASSGLLSRDERAARLLERRHELDLEEVLWCREAAALVATDYYDEQGFATPQEWLRISCHLTRGQASERVAVGTEIHSMPESLQALLAGEVGYGHVAAMAKTAHALRDSKTAARFDETMVMDKARESTVGRLYRDIEQMHLAPDADG